MPGGLSSSRGRRVFVTDSVFGRVVGTMQHFTEYGRIRALRTMTKYNWEVYDPARHLPMLMRWWVEMRDNGDLARALHSSMHNLHAFIKAFDDSTVLCFTANETGFLGCVWWTPIYSRVEAGAWQRPNLPGVSHDIRRLIRGLAVTHNGVILMTSQSGVGTLNAKMGAELQCTLPGAMDGKDLQIWYLDGANVKD